MCNFPVPILIFVLTAAATMFYFSVRGSKWPFSLRDSLISNLRSSPRQKAGTLNCRAKLTKAPYGEAIVDAFLIEICGYVHSPCKACDVILKILVADITDGLRKTEPVLTNIEKWQLEQSRVFCYTTELGRLSDSITLPDWIAVGQIPVCWLEFPRRGKRQLLFRTSVLSNQTGEEFAYTACSVTYENNSLGYADLEENVRRAKTLAVPLAFAVAAADKKISEREVEVIEDWTVNNTAISDSRDRNKYRLNKILGRTAWLFPGWNRPRCYRICKNIASIAPLALRYDILELCLRIVRADGRAGNKQLALLKNIAYWFEVYPERFRSMMEKIVPISMREIEDTEISLGITPDMDEDQTCHQLNKEYRKWNSRVTNSDSEVQAEAEYMLNKIAKARNQYVKQDLT